MTLSLPPHPPGKSPEGLVLPGGQGGWGCGKADLFYFIAIFLAVGSSGWVGCAILLPGSLLFARLNRLEEVTGALPACGPK